MNNQTENEHELFLDIIQENTTGTRRKPIKYKVNSDNCWECTSHSGVYPKVFVKGKKYLLSRLVLENKLNRRLRAEFMEVARHRCDNPKCINPDHLEEGTQKDNGNDMATRDRSAFGKKNGKAILTEDDVVKIKKLMIAGNLSTEEMCEMFDVASGTISNISTGITWRRVLVNEFEPNKNGKRKKTK